MSSASGVVCVLLGVFDAGFWDVRVEYAKNSPRDLLCRYTVSNESNNAAVIHVLPTLWFRSALTTTLLVSSFPLSSPKYSWAWITAADVLQGMFMLPSRELNVF